MHHCTHKSVDPSLSLIHKMDPNGATEASLFFPFNVHPLNFKETAKKRKKKKKKLKHI